MTLPAADMDTLALRALCPPGTTFYTVAKTTRSGAFRNRYYVRDGDGLTEVTAHVANVGGYETEFGSLAFKGMADPIHDFMLALYGEPVPDYRQEWL